MNKSLIPFFGLLICFSFACQSKDVKAKKQMIENRIYELKSKIGVSDSLQSNAGDSIIGIWELNNDYYMAIYEIIKYDKQYFGKIHYYNDGKTEYKGTNSKKDYFLTDLTYENGKYSFCKMHMPDGSHYQVKILLDGDEITAQMTIQGEPYQEIWKRKKIEDVGGSGPKQSAKQDSTIIKPKSHDTK